jgi:hypothetical protein
MTSTLFIFARSKVEPQICQNLGTILDAENIIILQLFLSPVYGGSKLNFVFRKLNLCGLFYGNFGIKFINMCKFFSKNKNMELYGWV